MTPEREKKGRGPRMDKADPALRFVKRHPVGVRYRTETQRDSEGNETEVEVPYNYYICTVTLEKHLYQGTAGLYGSRV